jgi:hypothetical protein
MGRRRTKAAITAAAASIVIMLASHPAHAQRAPRDNCVAVSKGEFDAATRTNKASNRYGAYERTRSLLRSHYWYCRELDEPAGRPSSLW